MAPKPAAEPAVASIPFDLEAVNKLHDAKSALDAVCGLLLACEDECLHTVRAYDLFCLLSLVQQNLPPPSPAAA